MDILLAHTGTGAIVLRHPAPASLCSYICLWHAQACLHVVLVFTYALRESIVRV